MRFADFSRTPIRPGVAQGRHGFEAASRYLARTTRNYSRSNLHSLQPLLHCVVANCWLNPHFTSHSSRSTRRGRVDVRVTHLNGLRMARRHSCGRRPWQTTTGQMVLSTPRHIRGRNGLLRDHLHHISSQVILCRKSHPSEC